ncbi:MAG: PLDc N-terminal domain-containing protein [Thermoanaerobaculia bacterium]
MMGIGLPELAILLIFLPATAFWVWMIIEAATKETGDDRLIWVLIVIFTHFLGAVIYFFVRRRRRLVQH